ncbi:FAD-binding oxidoreductase [Undibacterium sp. TS12]|uniref:NAD(P)/FAD-dependent oxidoreductase n=1 Tax=Undibacterium sp. TS12 TaxID=2908202 RepID=UPI001F4CCD62|nr:FAD-binding oxidoreductase [Undibacterium sp. TS12]MCH8619388.1 FAD-binding oxidoreductase [Undibacterium sp. TS12]
MHLNDDTMLLKENLSRTFYQATANNAVCPSLHETLDCEVCIIGGGFAGLATALGLLERGVKNIVLLEAEQIGHGASGRNGGFVFGGFSLDNAELLRQLGREPARRLYQLTLDGVDLIRKRIRQYSIDCDINESGVLLANWFDDEKALIRQREFMLREFAVDWSLWSREQTRASLQTDRYSGALHEKNAFHFHPLKYAQGLARTLSDSDVKVFEQSRVTSIDNNAADKQVRTSNGLVKARHVVVCCGGYIEKLYPQLAASVLPIATYVMATEKLGEQLQTAMKTGAAVYDTRFAFDYYRPLADSRLLWGGRISIQEKQPEQVASLLYRDMLKVYPQLAGTRVEYAWSGLMSYARHKMPQIGCLPNGIWYAMGFGGHGVAPTTLAGELVAQAIAHGKTLLTGLDQYGLPPVFGKLGLMAAQCAYWYYELRDWMRE